MEAAARHAFERSGNAPLLAHASTVGVRLLDAGVRPQVRYPC